MKNFVLLCCVMLSTANIFENEKEYDEMLLRIMEEDAFEKSESVINEIQTNEENNQIISDVKTSVFINPQRIKREVIEGGSGEVEECPEVECKSNSGYICKTPMTPECNCMCECAPGYYNPNNSISPIVCTKGKVFGGKITFIDDYDESQNDIIKEATKSLFSDTKGFIDIIFLSIREGSIIVEYELIYENSPLVNSSTVKSGIGCIDTVVISTLSLELNITESCKTAVDPSVPCGESGTFAKYCDSQTTECGVNEYGYAVCSCNDPSIMYNINKTVCIDQICSTNANCNGPFGWCNEESIRTCTCMWGFDGVTCDEPWLFALTVVASGCGLIIIILIGTACYCSRRAKNNFKANKNSKRLADNGEIDLQNPFTSFQPGMMRAWLPEGSRNVEDMQMTSIANGRPSNSPSLSTGRHNSNETGQTNGHTNAGFEGTSHQRGHSSTFAPANSSRSSQKDKAQDYF